MQQIIKDITQITRQGIRFRKFLLEPLGISNRHATYLMKICQTPGITQEQLSRQIHVDKSNVARQVAILEEAAFLERKPDLDDKRIIRLYPTEKALSLLPQITEVFNEWEDYLTQSLSAEEKAILGALLSRLNERAEERLEALNVD